ncbi:MAG: hypothetical protein JST16_06640 [Bdellovibrionales bacterium]|nr:hypothetical protein [Bdellovibrionales bacterium]
MNAFWAATLATVLTTPVTAAPTPAPAPKSEAKKVLTIITPVKVKESQDSNLVQVDRSESDMELNLWDIAGTRHFDVAINVTKVNQAILPTDEHGKLTKDATTLTERPFIRFYVAGREPETHDISCSRTQCKALWKNIPLDATKPQSFKVEVNIRGLRGKNWTAGYNQLFIKGTPLQEVGKAPGQPDRTIYWSPDFYWPPAALAPWTIESSPAPVFEELNFKEGEKTQMGFGKSKRLIRFALIEGKMAVEVTNGEYLEKRELNAGEVLWIPPGQILSVENYGPPYAKARALKFEFNKP